MNKRVFIVHGWESHPEDGWFPWLKEELEAQGFIVEVPAMPHPSTPTIADWVTHLSTKVGEVDANTFFIGHSIGCQTIMRYLQTLPDNQKIGGVVFVAGWFNLINLETAEENELARPWLETPIDFEKLKKQTNNYTAIFSDDDKWVPLSDKDLFAKHLNANIVVEHAKGHFSGYEGTTQIPSVLEAIIDFSL